MKKILLSVYVTAPVWISLLVGFLFSFKLLDTILLAVAAEAIVIFFLFISYKINFELFRKIIHVAGILFIICMIYMNIDRNLLLLVVGTIAALSIPVYLSPRIFPDIIKDLAVRSVRSNERSIRCVTHFLVSAFIMLLFLPYNFIILGLVIALIGDPMAFFIGTRYGRIKIVREKTLEGSLAFFFTVFAALLLLNVNLTAAFIGSITGAVIEHITGKYLDDNATTPLAAALVLSI